MVPWVSRLGGLVCLVVIGLSSSAFARDARTGEWARVRPSAVRVRPFGGVGPAVPQADPLLRIVLRADKVMPPPADSVRIIPLPTTWDAAFIPIPTRWETNIVLTFDKP